MSRERCDQAVSRPGVPARNVRALAVRFALGVLTPQLLFYLGLRSGGPTAALIAAGGWTVGLHIRDLALRKAVDPLVLYGLLVTLFLCTVALVARSPVVYAGAGIVENVLSAALLLGALVFCPQWLLRAFAAIAGDRPARTLPVPATLWPLTVLWAALLLARSAGLYVALRHLTIGQFLIVNTVAGWPLNGVGVLLSLFYLRGQLDVRDIMNVK